MPEHLVLSGGTLRKFLCGDEPEGQESKGSKGPQGEEALEPWPMILRSSMSAEDGAGGSLAGCFESVVVRDTTPQGLWLGFKQVVASAFSFSIAERLLGAGVDPLKFR